MQKGSRFTFTTKRLGDGVWVEHASEMQFELKFFKVIGAKGVQNTMKSDYHKFEVSSRVIDAQ